MSLFSGWAPVGLGENENLLTEQHFDCISEALPALRESPVLRPQVFLYEIAPVRDNVRKAIEESIDGASPLSEPDIDRLVDLEISKSGWGKMPVHFLPHLVMLVEKSENGNLCISDDLSIMLNQNNIPESKFNEIHGKKTKRDGSTIEGGSRSARLASEEEKIHKNTVLNICHQVGCVRCAFRG